MAYGWQSTFRTREEMEAEIRAGRMFPLGLVKVPSPTGGWKETDLVVYAHRVPRGKFVGKTALVIYGLKAYVEHSELIAREMIRFKEYEKVLKEGGVIEQRIWDEAGSLSPSLSFEPLIHSGSNAVQETFQPLLGGLLEFRRCSLRQAWGLPVDQDEFMRARQQLTGLGIQPAEPDPLVQIDPSLQQLHLPSPGRAAASKPSRLHAFPARQISNAKSRMAEEGKRIEEIRAEVAAGKSEGVVLLNEALAVNGHLEIGPLLSDPQGQVIGEGMTSGAKAIEDIFLLINRLPVTDRARLRANHFAATAVEIDRDGIGNAKVFLTIEFPLGRSEAGAD